MKNVLAIQSHVVYGFAGNKSATAIAPLPCPNLHSYFSFVSKFQICKFSKMQLQLENQIPKLYLLRKCGLLAHTSAAFL